MAYLDKINFKGTVYDLQDSNLKEDLHTLSEDNRIVCTVTNQTGYYDKIIAVIPTSEAITSLSMSFKLAKGTGEILLSAMATSLYLDDTDDASLRGTPQDIASVSYFDNTITMSKTFSGLSQKSYAKIFFFITASDSSLNGRITFEDISILINGKEIEKVSHMYNWDTSICDISFQYKVNDIPPCALKETVDSLGIGNTTKRVQRSNVLTSIEVGSDVVHYGYRVPIKALKNISAIKLKNISTIASGGIRCAILDSGLNTLVYANNSFLNDGSADANVTFKFDTPVSISTDYGFLEISRSTAPINYNTLTNDDINTDVAVVPTSSIRGYFKDTASADWVRLGTSQSLKFNFVFDVFTYEPYAETAMDIYQNEVISDLQNKVEIIECGAGKKFQTLRSAIAKGCEVGGKVIVYPGTYDLTSEFATELAEHTARGILLYNDVHLVFMAGAYVTAHLDGSDSTEHYLFAPFQIEGSCTIEGLHIRATNTRYCVHDEMEGKGTYRVKYVGCDMACTNGTESPTFVQCIGGGLGRHGFIEIVGGKYRSFNSFLNSANVPAISYHNGTYADCDSKIFIRDIYLADQNYFRFGNYGNSIIKTPVYVSGCSMGNNIVHNNESDQYSNDNFEIFEWGNIVR